MKYRNALGKEISDSSKIEELGLPLSLETYLKRACVHTVKDALSVMKEESSFPWIAEDKRQALLVLYEAYWHEV